MIRLLFTGLLVVLVACSTTTKNEESQNSGEGQEAATTTETIADAEPEASIDPELGTKIFNQYCSVCHMKDGNGVPGLNPPLVNSPWVQGEKDQLISIVLKGSQGGQFEVNGETYTNVMIAHNFLSDDEVAAVLTYIRSNFENDADAITSEEVAEVRASLD